MGSDDGVKHSELPSFWTLSIVQYSKKFKNTTFRKLDLFPSPGQGGKTPCQLGPLEKLTSITGPNWLGVFPPWPEDGNRSSFRNVVFSNFLEYWTMDKVKKLSNSDSVNIRSVVIDMESTTPFFMLGRSCSAKTTLCVCELRAVFTLESAHANQGHRDALSLKLLRPPTSK
jgi:hypothetical protein